MKLDTFSCPAGVSRPVDVPPWLVAPRKPCTRRVLVPGLAVLAVLASATAARSQTCAVAAPPDHEVHPVFGGETWATFSDGDGASLRIWTGEDGGRIRVSHDAGATWQFADTPDDYAHTVLDIWFFPGGSHGFATGRGGRVLESTDGGLTWTYYGARILDAAGDPATLWGVRSLDDGTVFASGLWIFVRTVDLGASWVPVTVYDMAPSEPEATVIPHEQLELFRLDLVGVAGEFAGCVGAKWEEPRGNHGVLLFTRSSLSRASGGKNWWIVRDDADTPASRNGAVMLEPWAVRYERGSTSTTSSVAYAVGGPGGNHWSRHYRSTDSGMNWSFGGEISVTPYDVSSQVGGTAMIVCYSGRYLLRNPMTGAWTEDVMPSESEWLPTPGESTGALEGASTFGAQGLIATGDFGSQRISHDLGVTWTSMSDFYPTSKELEQRLGDCAFLPSAPLSGVVVGQLGRILRTTDGGCSFSDETPSYPAPTLNAVDFGNATFGVAVGQSGTIHATTDGGDTWMAGAFAPGTSFPPGLTAADISFRGVSVVGAGQAWAVGNFHPTADGPPVVAYSRTAGAIWYLMNAPVPSNLHLRAVDFANANGGLVVGHSNAGGGNEAARAFQASFNGLTLTWTDVSPTLPAPSSRLLDVAVSGSPLALAIACAVGDDGLVLEWTGSGFTPAPVSGSTPIRLLSVDVSPSGDTILIGGKYDTDLSTADHKGFLLRRAGGVWSTIRAQTGKDLVGISLTSDTTGYLVGQTGPGSDSFINGNLASSILLRYVAN